MSHKKLIRVLRLCPASELFGALKSQLNKETLHYGEAIKMTIQLVNKHLSAAQSVLDEVEELAAHLEESNNSAPIDIDSHRGQEEIPFDFQIDEEVEKVQEEEKEEEK